MSFQHAGAEVVEGKKEGKKEGEKKGKKEGKKEMKSSLRKSRAHQQEAGALLHNDKGLLCVCLLDY